MVDVFGAVRAYILADATVAGLIGTRLYPIKVPQAGTFPAATMQKITEPRFGHLRGGGALAAPRYQIDAWTRESFTGSQALAKAIRDRISGFAGVLEDSTESPATSYLVKIRFDDSRDMFEPDVNGGYYRTSTDYVIWHRPVTS